MLQTGRKRTKGSVRQKAYYFRKEETSWPSNVRPLHGIFWSMYFQDLLKMILSFETEQNCTHVLATIILYMLLARRKCWDGYSFVESNVVLANFSTAVRQTQQSPTSYLRAVENLCFGTTDYCTVQLASAVKLIQYSYNL